MSNFEAIRFFHSVFHLDRQTHFLKEAACAHSLGYKKKDEETPSSPFTLNKEESTDLNQELLAVSLINLIEKGLIDPEFNLIKNLEPLFSKLHQEVTALSQETTDTQPSAPDQANDSFKKQLLLITENLSQVHRDEMNGKKSTDLDKLYSFLKGEVKSVITNTEWKNLIASKLDIYQKTQELQSATNPEEASKSLLRSRAEYAETRIEVLKKKQMKLEEAIEELPKKIPSLSERIKRSLPHFIPEMSVLTLYFCGIIGGCLKLVGANIAWNSAWKLSIWTFMVHSKLSHFVNPNDNS